MSSGSGWATRRKWNKRYRFRQDEVEEMAIILRLDRVMADRKMSLNELSERVGISNVNLSNLKTGKVKAIRFSTLDAICDVLDCQPGDILEYQREEPQGR